MRSLYSIAILTTGSLSLAAQKPLQCDVLVNIDQPLPSEIRITLQHDKHCSITMDEGKNDSGHHHSGNHIKKPPIQDM